MKILWQMGGLHLEFPHNKPYPETAGPLLGPANIAKEHDHMVAAITAEDDPSNIIFYVGRDAAGHWLVQANHGQIEGRFVSQAAAWAFARSEARGIVGAAVISPLHPLTPTISFAPLGAHELTIHHAA